MLIRHIECGWFCSKLLARLITCLADNSNIKKTIARELNLRAKFN